MSTDLTTLIGSAVSKSIYANGTLTSGGTDDVALGSAFDQSKTIVSLGQDDVGAFVTWWWVSTSTIRVAKDASGSGDYYITVVELI